jgi:SAM-dependent methyltransferase
MVATAVGPACEPLRKRFRRAPGGRNAFVQDAIAFGAASVLDIGSGEGWLLGERPDIPRRVGIDTDPEVLDRAGRRYPDVDFRLVSGGSLPFGDSEFSHVVLSEVIEHVGDDKKQPVIDEAIRVLRPGGRLILTAPNAGLFAFLDPLDFKRRYPRLYRVYQRRTGKQPKTPAEIGHKHVTLEEIERLIAGRAVISRAEYSGPFTPLGDLPVAVSIVAGRDTPVLGRFQAWEMSLPAPRPLASNLRLVATRSS